MLVITNNNFCVKTNFFISTEAVGRTHAHFTHFLFCLIMVGLALHVEIHTRICPLDNVKAFISVTPNGRGNNGIMTVSSVFKGVVGFLI